MPPSAPGSPELGRSRGSAVGCGDELDEVVRRRGERGAAAAEGREGGAAAAQAWWVRRGEREGARGKGRRLKPRVFFSHLVYRKCAF